MDKILLNDKSKKNDTPNGINLKLKEHQKTLLARLHDIEHNDGIKYKVNNIENVCYTDSGLICDKVGAGKSLVVLSLIMEKPLLYFQQMSCTKNNSTYSICKMKDTKESTLNINIIVVPHNVFKQWEEYINLYTNLSVFLIYNKKTYEKFEKLTEEYLKNNKLLFLVSSKRYNNFTELLNTKVLHNSYGIGAGPITKVSRVFFDEIHSINIPNCQSIESNFYWFISSSIKDMKYISNYGFIRNKIESIFPYYYYNDDDELKDFHSILAKNSDEFIDSSLKIPEYIVEVIRCKLNKLYSVLGNTISQKVKDMLFAEDMNGILQEFGIETSSKKNILSLVTSNLEKDLKNAKLEKEYKEKYSFSSENTRKEAMKNINNKILSIQIKIDDLKERIFGSNIDPISHEDIKNPVIVPCCKNKFDLKTLTEYFQYTSVPICALCRKKINLSEMIHIGKDKEKIVKDIEYVTKKFISEEHSKMENLEWLLSNKVDINDSLLIFSDYEPNQSINTVLKKVNRSDLSTIKGTINTISSLIKKYKEGSIKTLFLNATHSGSGLNLENTDTIIIMHKMSSDMEKQVIGRAQRLGRKTQLKIYKLYAVNE